jgi:hypothetical protein
MVATERLHMQVPARPPTAAAAPALPLCAHWGRALPGGSDACFLSAAGTRRAGARALEFGRIRSPTGARVGLERDDWCVADALARSGAVPSWKRSRCASRARPLAVLRAEQAALLHRAAPTVILLLWRARI